MARGSPNQLGDYVFNRSWSPARLSAGLVLVSSGRKTRKCNGANKTWPHVRAWERRNAGFVLAHKWYILGAANGDNLGAEHRDALAKANDPCPDLPSATAGSEVGAGKAVEAERQMSDDRPKRETMSVEKLTVSNMGKIAAIVEVLERLGGIIEMGSGWRRGRRTSDVASASTCVNAGNLTFFPEHGHKLRRRSEKYLSKDQEKYSQNPLPSFCG